METKRDITKVIDEMLELIPEDNEAMVRDLKSIRSHACYTAPEIMGPVWGRAGEVLGHYIGPAHLLGGWRLQVANIFMGRT